MKQLVEAVFFDFDGTLGDTQSEIRGAWKKALSSLHIDCPDFEKVYRVGPSLQETSKLLAPQLCEAEHEQLRAVYKSFYDDSELNTTSPYPWVPEMLAELFERGKRLYVVTNKRMKPTGKLLEHYGLKNFFSGVFCPDVCPDIAAMHKNRLLCTAVNVSGIAPEKCLMVGDTELDIIAGHSANVRTCAVTWGYAPLEKILPSEPDIIIRDCDFMRGFDENFC